MSELRVEAPGTTPSRWKKAAIAVSVGLVALAAAKVLLALPSPGFSGALSRDTLLLAFGPAALSGFAWAVVTVVLVATAPPTLAAGVSIAAAPLVPVGVLLAWYWPGLVEHLPGGLILLVFPIALESGPLLLSAAIGWAVAGGVARFSLLSRRRAPRSAR